MKKKIVFPLISAPSTSLTSKHLQVRCLLEVGAFFKVRGINNVIFQGFAIVFFKPKTRDKTSHSIKPKNTKISKRQHFHCSTVCIIFPHAFWLKYYQNMVGFLISTNLHFSCLLEGRHLSQCGCIKVRFYQRMALTRGPVSP